MESHFSLTDTEFERLFETASLDPALFTHEAHLRLAWIHIRQYGPDKASYNIVNQLQEYVKALGAEDKFSLSLTIASLKIVNHFVDRSATTSFETFIAEFPGLKTNFRQLLEEYSNGMIATSGAERDYQEHHLMHF